jgi:hypothetical protein
MMINAICLLGLTMDKKDDIQLYFEAPVGRRVHRYFSSVKLTEITDDNLWWNSTLRKWEPYGTHPDHWYSNNAPCRTLKAFIRMRRKNPEIIGRCCLINRYYHYNVYG